MPLTPCEFEVLHKLMANEGHVVPAATLAERARDYASDAATRVKAHIVNLRRRLGESARAPRYLHTVPGLGYMFRGP